MELAEAQAGGDYRFLAIPGVSTRYGSPAPEVDALADTVSSRRPYRALAPSEAAALPGRGCAFLIHGKALRSDWREVCGAAAATADAKALAVRFDPAAWAANMSRIVEAYGLSDVERALASELAEFGRFDAASAAAGLNFNAARNALARLRAKLGTRNLPETVEHLLLLMFAPSGEEPRGSEEVVAEMLDLTEEQLRMARMVAGGMPRKQVASLLKCSMASLKARLSEVYETLGIESACELSCLLAQAERVAEVFVRRAEGDYLAHPIARHEELISAQRKIGYSAYGGPDGPVVIILHSTITCRHPPSRLVRQLVRRGFRVIAPDRPGFGDTEPAAHGGIEAHVRQAARDLQAIALAEDFEAAILVSRGAAQMAIALSEQLPDLLGRAVLINPTPPIGASSVDRGPLGAVKRRFARNPASIRLMIHLLLRFATPERLVAGMRRAYAQSPPDIAALNDKLMVEDYRRAAAPLRQQLDGYIIENTAWSHGWEVQSPRQGAGWTLLIGRHFVLHEPVTAQSYFRHLLPKSKAIVVDDAGQMLAYSHSELVAEAISE